MSQPTDKTHPSEIGVGVIKANPIQSNQVQFRQHNK